MSIQPEFAFYLEYVSDVDAAMRFYTDVVGLKVERYHPTFVQFDRFAIASDASMSGTREAEVYWTVPDAEAAFSELSQKAQVVMPLKQMPFGKVFGIQGPTGKPLYLLELAQNRPSQAV
jgi:predicted enzyme related to lactoylglutathione lyase